MRQFFLLFFITTLYNSSAICQKAAFKPSFSAGLDTLEGRLLLRQCSRVTPRNILHFWTLTPGDIDTLENNFEKIYTLISKGCCGQGSQVHDLKKFGFQYIGVIIKGKKFIYINAFPITEIEMMKNYKPDFDPSKTTVMVCDGGSDFWGALFDMKTKDFSYLAFNGDA